VRQFVVILCLLLNVSVMLMAFDTTHAHVDATAAAGVDVHSGHDHDFDLHSDVDHHDASEHVVDMKASLGTLNPFQSTFWSDWLPLVWFVALTLLAAPLCVAVFSSRTSDPRPPSRRGHWRPPLRGPPAFSIR
jgi:hypothetical protein